MNLMSPYLHILCANVFSRLLSIEECSIITDVIKVYGGAYGQKINFTKLAFFNQAFLAKHGWRLLEGSSSLAHQVLKQSTSSMGYNQSYSW
ncbi:hypothetical protein V2J09_021491 [Rumex salicifolius]